MKDHERGGGQLEIDQLNKENKEVVGDVSEKPVTSEKHDPTGSPSAARGSMDRVVFVVAAGVAAAFLVWGVLATDSLGSVTSAVLDWLIRNTGWAFLLAATGFVLFAVWLAFSRYGKIPLGADDERPEFRTVSWIAMMFSAGMGIGLMFWGVAEPLSHFVEPPPGTVEGSTDAAVETAMATSLFHWAIHPWSMYAVVGLAIAYGTFRRGRRQLISSAFAPLFGTRVSEGPIGKLIDVLAIFATLFGSAASLGLGALQIGSGLFQRGWLADNPGAGLLIGVIALLTVAFVASAVSGVAKGIQWLSNINMVLAALLAVFVFVVGPTVFILNLIPSAIGDYFREMGDMISRSGASGGENMESWLSSWTIFYWAWWISWTPFVGMFIARISRGRTIKQFVSGVILVPSVVSLVWFSIMGGTAINLQRDGTDLAGASTPQSQLFGVLDNFPLAAVASVVVMVLVAIFFVSGADAASLVMGSMSQRGALEPRRWLVVFWGVATGGVAAVMLLVGGGGDAALTGLQNLTIIAAAPFALVMVVLCVALAKDLRSDPMVLREKHAAVIVEQAVDTGNAEYDGDFCLQVAPTSTTAATNGNGKVVNPVVLEEKA
jgi:choline/carnitine/betaine transport